MFVSWYEIFPVFFPANGTVYRYWFHFALWTLHQFYCSFQLIAYFSSHEHLFLSCGFQYFIHFVDNKKKKWNGIVTIVKMLPIECNWVTICLIVSWLHRIDVLYVTNEIKEIRFIYISLYLTFSFNNTTDVNLLKVYRVLFSSPYFMYFYHLVSNWTWMLTISRYVINYITSIWFISHFFFVISSFLFFFIWNIFSLVCIQVLEMWSVENWTASMWLKLKRITK